ncbi:MAG: NADH-quinone oxidoreductase subunit J [Patescibacteria group bacterium]|nr:NADH-quinone oxidoreductase subunit J [Patescibacteria group bacterium]
MVDFLEFAVLSIVILSSIFAVFSKNVLLCALSLAINTSFLGFFFILKNLLFLGLVQIAVYAGGIIVLILFTIMILGLKNEISKSLSELIFGSMVFLVIFCVVFFSLPDFTWTPVTLNVAKLGDALSGDYLPHLLAIGVILNCALVVYLLIVGRHHG